MRNQKLKRYHHFWNAIILLFIVINISIWSWYVYNKKQLFDKDYANCTQLVSTIRSYNPSFQDTPCGEKRIKSFLETVFNTNLTTVRAKQQLETTVSNFNLTVDKNNQEISNKTTLVTEAGFTSDIISQTKKTIPFDDILYQEKVIQDLDTTISSINTKLESLVIIAQRQANNLSFLVDKNPEILTLTKKLKEIGEDSSVTKIKQFTTVTQLTKNLPELLLSQAKANGLWNGEDGENFLQFRYFTDEGFNNYLTKLDFEKLFPTAPIIKTIGVITSLPTVDTYIQAFGQKRGYLVRKTIEPKGLLPIESFSFFDQGVEFYSKMKENARSQGISFVVSSGFRDFEAQKLLWQEQYNSVANTLLGRIPADSEILSGSVDEVLDKTMARVAAPGFSRHHTGMAMDLNDEFTTKPFDQTPAFAWLSNNNYLNAKKFGFMPSYPKVELDIKFGPNPESWEYVFVGVGSLKLY
jgi:hypothetical protein